MADRIKGITVEIGGDVTGLNKALAGTNKEIKSTQTELKDVERLLRLDPKNTELLRQKQQLLGGAVLDTRNKLESLNKANDKVKESVKNYDAWKAAYDPVKAKISETDEKLKHLRKTQDEFRSAGNINTAEYNAIQLEIDQTSTDLKLLKKDAKAVSDEFGNPVSHKQYDGLQREIVETKEQLKGLETQASQSNAVLSKIKTTANGVASGAGKVSSAMTPATVAIAGLGGMAFKAASDMEESQNKVAVAFGDSATSVQAFAETSLESFGLAKGTALDMASTYGDMGTSMGIAQDEAADMSTSLTGLAGDLSSFKNIGVDQAATALNGVFTGETESLKQLGIIMTQTNLDNYALANGFGKTTKSMTESEKVSLRYAYVMDATKNSQGDFARTADGAANSIRIMGESTKEAGAEFGIALLPVITPLIQKVTELIKGFTSLDMGQKKTIITILALVAAIAPVAGIIGGIATIVGVCTTAMGTFSLAMAVANGAATTTSFGVGLLAGAINFLMSPITIIILLVVGLVAAFAWLWNKSEAFRNFFIGMWENIKTAFTATVDYFNLAITDIGSFFTSLWLGIENGARSAINFIINGINNMVAAALAPINFLISAMNLIPGVNIGKLEFAIPNLPMLAKGGNVVRGSAIVGEAGAELLTVTPQGTRVTPLSGGSSGAGPKAGVTVNMNATFYGYKQSDGTACVRDLNRQLGRLYG